MFAYGSTSAPDAVFLTPDAGSTLDHALAAQIVAAVDVVWPGRRIFWRHPASGWGELCHEGPVFFQVLPMSGEDRAKFYEYTLDAEGFYGYVRGFIAARRPRVVRMMRYMLDLPYIRNEVQHLMNGNYAQTGPERVAVWFRRNSRYNYEGAIMQALATACEIEPVTCRAAFKCLSPVDQAALKSTIETVVRENLPDFFEAYPHLRS